MLPAKGMTWMVDYKRLGHRIRQARVDRGLTQAELAELADVSTPYVSHVERGAKTISLNTLTRVAESLGTTLDSLLLGRLRYGGRRSVGGLFPGPAADSL